MFTYVLAIFVLIAVPWVCMLDSSLNWKQVCVKIKLVIRVILLIYTEGTPTYIIQFSHAFMPSECGLQLYNASTSIDTMTALWGTDLVMMYSSRIWCCIRCTWGFMEEYVALFCQHMMTYFLWGNLYHIL